MNLTGAVLLELPTQLWECPNCDTTDRTQGHMPNRFHQCRGTGIYAGLMAPLVPAGTKAKVVAVEREDYIAGEDVQLHQGRPVMSVITTRDDGQDCAVFAPTATASATA
jgi:hypothetical protein